MKDLGHLFLPQRAINYFYHLPVAILANIYYGFPTRGLKVIGVTGTDGKTTSVNMIYQILKDANKKVSMVSTINVLVAGKSYDTGFHVTSPDPFLVQKFARQAAENGDEFLVLEVTSHALDQFRFWGIKFEVGVITNITHEHLDYHKTFENYKKTKYKLLKNAKFKIKPEDFKKIKIPLKLKIPGLYNRENALAALAVSEDLGIDQDSARKTLENFTGLAGRMEEVRNKRSLKVIIDFAHTPNALEQALKTLRYHMTSGKLIAVIGAEGFRDVGKREMMGEIAQRLADIVVLTAVDPRGQLEIINKQIIAGAKTAGGILDRNLFVVDDRQEAINFAINNLAKKSDTVGIFGKGHEKSLNLDGKKEIPWSEKKIVEKVLKS